MSSGHLPTDPLGSGLQSRRSRRLHQFSRTLYGYRPAAVMEHISRLELAHREKMARYLEEMASVQAECEDKTKEMDALRQAVAQHQEQESWIARAIEDARVIAARMVQRAQDSLQEMEARAEASLADYRRTLAALRTECLSAREELDKLASNVRLSLDLGERQEVSSSKVVGRIVPLQQKANVLVATGADGLLRLGVVGPRLKVITQGGTEVGYVTRYVVEQATGTMVGYEIGSTSNEQVPVGSIIPSSAVLAITADSLLVSGNIATQLVGTSLVHGEEAYAPATTDVHRPPQVITGSSPEQRQLRYMVGKLAGRDLVDQDGTVIIAKGVTIDEEIVARARDAGLLPHLIVNMVLPRSSGGETAKGS